MSNGLFKEEFINEQELNDLKKQAAENIKIFNSLEKREINLYVLVDSGGYICYTSKDENLVQSYKESNCFNDKTVVKLTGFLPQGEK